MTTNTEANLVAVETYRDLMKAALQGINACTDVLAAASAVDSLGEERPPYLRDDVLGGLICAIRTRSDLLDAKLERLADVALCAGGNEQ